ncbi:MAG: hypothetical protein FWE61_09990, partial [Micrococcales bacterium]|nr:hypothetical protein [Micrococcales bacterium]
MVWPQRFPIRHDEMNVDPILAAAGSLRVMGIRVFTGTLQAHATWGGLTHCYVAPEGEAVYALLGPALQTAGDVQTRLRTAAGVLDRYAAELEGLRGQISEVVTDCETFRQEVVGGVWRDAATTKQAGFTDYLRAAGNFIPGVEERKVLVSWKECDDLCDRNTKLQGEYTQVLVKVSEAATRCANDLSMLPAHSCSTLRDPFTEEQIALWWGPPVTEDRNCMESVGHGAVYRPVWETVHGVEQFLGRDPKTGAWWSGESAAAAWIGLDSLLIAVAGSGNPVTGPMVQASMWATWTGHPVLASWVPEFPGTEGSSLSQKEQGVLLAGVLGGFVNWDGATPDDPWHEYKEDGVAATFNSVVNVATVFVGFGAARGGAKGAVMGGRLGKAVEAVDFVVPGGARLVNGAVRGVSRVSEAVRLGDLFTEGGRFGRISERLTFSRRVVDDLPDLKPKTPVSDNLFNRAVPKDNPLPPAHTPEPAPQVPQRTREPVQVGGRAAADDPFATRPGGEPAAG